MYAETVLLERVEADRVPLDELAVDAVVLDQLLGEPVQDREVRARLDREVNLRLARRLRLARVDHDRARRIGAAQPVELVHPENRLRLGRVDPDVQDRVAVLDVVDAAGWPSQPNVSFSDCPAVAVQSRVLPSRWFVPIPPRATRASV